MLPLSKGRNPEIVPISSFRILLARTWSCDHTQLQRRLGFVVLS
jgi:hypothetical protein